MESSGFVVAVLLVVFSTAIQDGSADLEEAWEKYLVNNNELVFTFKIPAATISIIILPRSLYVLIRSNSR
jgi:hypothetical protein